MTARFVDGQWVILGPLPHGIVAEQSEDGFAEFKTAEGKPTPECFGVWWEAAGTTEETAECRPCVFADLCLEKVARGKFQEIQKQAKNGVTLLKLSKLMDVNEQAVLAIMAHSQEEPSPTQVKKKEPIETREAQNPQVAPSVTSATDGAEAKKETIAKPVQVRAGNKRIPWGEHTHAGRTQREREQSLWLEKVPVGAVLVRKYKEQTYQCRILHNGYEYNLTAYPTLQAVTNAIVGMRRVFAQNRADGTMREGMRLMCSWSANRFWKRAKITFSEEQTKLFPSSVSDLLPKTKG